MKGKLLFLSLTIFSIYSRAQGFSVTYSFTAVSNGTSSTGVVDPTPVPNVNGIICGSFVAVGTATAPNAGSRFSFTGWPLGATDGVDTYSTFTGALTPTVYYEVKISPVQGYTYNLNSISFAMRRSGTGVRNYAVRSSLDLYGVNLSASTGTNSKLSVVSPDIFFWNSDAASNSSDQKGSVITLGSAFSNLTDTVRFRFYAWNAEAPGGTFSIDDLVITGSISQPTYVTVPLVENQKALIIFPNPTAGSIVVNSLLKKTKIDVVDANGRIVLESSINDGETINLNTLKAGIYFVIIYSDEAIVRKKLILNDN